MGGRIPKKAQRQIDKANKQVAAIREVRKVEAAAIPIPRRMVVGVTPREVMNLHEVYLDGVKQRLCTYVDVDSGTIHRWRYGNENVPMKGSPIDEMQGKVEIRRRAL